MLQGVKSLLVRPPHAENCLGFCKLILDSKNFELPPNFLPPPPPNLALFFVVDGGRPLSSHGFCPPQAQKMVFFRGLNTRSAAGDLGELIYSKLLPKDVAFFRSKNIDLRPNGGSHM
jgi:hypothetical protein